MSPSSHRRIGAKIFSGLFNRVFVAISPDLMLSSLPFVPNSLTVCRLLRMIRAQHAHLKDLPMISPAMNIDRLAIAGPRNTLVL
jgi:hypothetical protein